jgi:hypothetical protein
MRTILDQVAAPDNYRLIVVGANSLAVFDRTGNMLGQFRLAVPGIAATGVHVRVDEDLPLRRLVRSGRDYVPGGNSGGNLNFNRDVTGQEQFNDLMRGHIGLYIVPAAAAHMPSPSEVPEEEPDPLMQFNATASANTPAWPGAVVPLTPQITATDTIGSFLMRVENNQGSTTLDRVTNLMQPINYRWEVLKLDAGFLPMQGETRAATRWDAVSANFERRQHDLEADRRTRLGEHPERQSLPERAVRVAIDQQFHETRTILAMAGETVMTFVRAVTGGPDNPFSEDLIDVPFREVGDYFVRCIATPVSNEGDRVRRASTVGGVTVSVFDIGEFAADALGTDATDREAANARIAEIDTELEAASDESDTSPGAIARRSRQRAFLGFERTYRQEVVNAEGDQTRVLFAERDWVQARITWLTAPSLPSGDEAFTEQVRIELAQLRTQEERLLGLLARSGSRVGSGYSETGMMRALMVDEAVGGRNELYFAFSERNYIAFPRTEIVITDVTGENGRVFSGMADGYGVTARRDALRAAMRDLRQNLNRGRGYLAYRMPLAYRGIDLDLPNPMQLQMALLDQVVETIDDTAHAATLAAILAAPFTGGTSLEVLMVLAPVQAGTSLYRIVDRAAYKDLRLDAQAISDFINIASFGLGGAGGVSRFASRGVQIAASAQRVAVLLLDGGNYIVMGWQAFREITAAEEGEDPRVGRQRRLVALLTLLEGTSIPVASHLWPTSHARGRGKAEPHPTEGRSARSETTRTAPHPHDATPVPNLHEGADIPAHSEGTSREVIAVEPGHPSDFPELSRGLPSDLAGSLPIVRDTSTDFGATTVRVEYSTDAHGVITDLQLRVGRRATARHIAEHVRTVRTMQRYQGLSGRVRILVERIGAWLRLHPEAGPGTRAWEAKLELEKLPSIIEARARELIDPATTAARRAELEAEIHDLESQLAEHSAAVESFLVEPGRGYVAAEGRSAGAAEAQRRDYPRLPDPTITATDGTPMGEYIWRYRNGELEVINRGEGPKMIYDRAIGEFRPDTMSRDPEPRFVESTTLREAYDALGGFEPNSDFGSFTQMLIREGLAPNHDALITQLQAPGGLTYRTVRHNLKERYRQNLIDFLVDPVRLSVTSAYTMARRRGMNHIDALRAASHAEMLRVTRGLGVADSGAVAERWYNHHWGIEAGLTATQVEVSRADAEAMGVTLTEDRRLDRVSGSMIEELKNVSTALAARDRAEIDDQLSLVGHTITVGGMPHNIDFVKVSILDPEGVLANANYMYERLRPGAPVAESLIFELHSSTGSIMMVTSENRAILTNRTALLNWIRTGRRP